MDLHLVTNQENEKLNYYKNGDIEIDSDNFTLLGFKDLKAVVDLPMTDSIKEQSNNLITNVAIKKIMFKIQVDELGEKYININGQKLKVESQDQIPQEVRKRTMLLKPKMLKTGNLNKPLKVCVISGATQLTETKADIKDNSISNSLIDKLHSASNPKKLRVISVKNVIKSVLDDTPSHSESSCSTTDSVNPKTLLANCQGSTSEQTGSFTVKFPSAKQTTKLLTSKNIEILNKVKMQALNLSTRTKVTDSAVQTDSKVFIHQTVQTELELNKIDYSSLDQLRDFCEWVQDGESPVINNINLAAARTVSPSVVSVKMPVCDSVVMKIDNEDRLNRKKCFFLDLNECLKPTLNGNLPIHEGVIKSDFMLVKRMCMALKARSVGINQENSNGCAVGVMEKREMTYVCNLKRCTNKFPPFNKRWPHQKGILKLSDVNRNITPLQLSIINNSKYEIVKILLDHGADVLEVDGEGNNILHLAAKFERHEILKIILHHQIFRQHFKIINSFNFDGLTPLMVCCMSNWTEGAVLLVNQNADVNLRDQTSGRTALFHAAEAHNDNIVRLLLESGADPKIKNFFGTSPHDAMYELEEMPEIIKNLIFGKTKKRSIEAEMNPVRTAKAAKNLKTFSRLQRIELKSGIVPIRYSISEVK